MQFRSPGIDSVHLPAGARAEHHCNAHNVPLYRRLRRRAHPKGRSAATAAVAATSASGETGGDAGGDVSEVVTPAPAVRCSTWTHLSKF